MAAPMNVTRVCKLLGNASFIRPLKSSNALHFKEISRIDHVKHLSFKSLSNGTTGKRLYKKLAFSFGALSVGYYAYQRGCRIGTVIADTGNKPNHTPSRSIKSSSDSSGLKLTLYQYETCPFCCKTRAYLDYFGYSYDVVEVNSVWRTQIKWSQYKKVPILVCHEQGEDFVQLNDSSVIISILESHLEDRGNGVGKISSYYPGLETTNSKGKKVIEYPNKYFVMYGEKDIKSSTPDQRKEERKWRKWTDEHLVHLISPNIYRTKEEAVEAFRSFDQRGEWEKHFSTFERKVVIYVGATAMYYVGKMLKKKYDLKEDVRESLYEACDDWTKAIGKKREFMGGDRPNLADLAVYGVLNSMEGCDAFKDMMNNKSKMQDWYNKTKYSVEHHLGSQIR